MTACTELGFIRTRHMHHLMHFWRNHESASIIWNVNPLSCLQAKLVGLLEAIGQGTNQQLPAPYPHTSMDSTQQYLGPLGDLPHQAATSPGPGQLHQAMMAAPAPQQTSSALTPRMISQFNKFGLHDGTSPAPYGLPDAVLGFLPQMGPPLGSGLHRAAHVSPSALPPEHIAAWQAAWLQQPLSAGSHTYQG